MVFPVLLPLQLLRIYNLHSSISFLILDVTLVLSIGRRVAFRALLYHTYPRFGNPTFISELS